MIRRFNFIFIFTIILNVLYAAILSAQLNKRSLQFKISGINFSSYERIKNHAEYVTSVSLPISNRFLLRHEMTYYQYKHYWNPRSFEYRGTTYTARNGQLWRDISISSNLCFYFWKKLYSGIGPGIDFIYVKRVLYTEWRAFWVNYKDEVIEVGKQESEQTKICFSNTIITGWEKTVWRNVSFILEGKYKIIIAGKELTDTDDSIVQSFSLIVGFEYKF
ncbi:hypothetical protein H8E88_28000 [candidate division KSB1 bacterium]|nr:hypothetical protein [candidate division KSB1 bacterium]MBL7095303.1 hypothetical protein [candidate division KSB1 bacterium]